MNVKNHTILGIISGSIGLLMYLEVQNFDLLVTSALLLTGGGLGALFPDILEPPKDWSHREFFHSRRMLLGLMVSFSFLFLTLQLWYNIPVIILLFGVISGYLSHLFSDATTPVSLPP